MYTDFCWKMRLSLIKNNDAFVIDFSVAENNEEPCES